MTNHDRNEILDVAHLSVLVSSLGGLGAVLGGLAYCLYFSFILLVGVLSLFFF